MSAVFAKIQMRRGTAAQWAAANPVLAQGELAFETDTGLTKIGDGATAYASLPAYATYDQMLAAKQAIDEAAIDVAAVNAARNTATAAATTATTKAGEAAASASAALASEQAAEVKANEAEQSAIDASAAAGIATAKADEIVASANAAAADAAAADADRIAAEAARTASEAAQAIAQGAAAGALASEVAADLSADLAAGSAAQTLAIYGSVEAQQAAVAVAQAQASLAAGFAASAASVVQQDLSGVTAQALHRSPNAVTAMFLYDTSKDSDGGAWTEKCQHTSWWNEAINGKWLGPQVSEFEARYAGAAVSTTQLVGAGWTVESGVGWAISGAAARHTEATGGGAITQTITVTPGIYEVVFSVAGNPVNGSGTANTSLQIFDGTTLRAGVANGPFGSEYTFFDGSPTYRRVVIVTGTSLRLRSYSDDQFQITGVSARAVTAVNTASGDYYQSSADGRFYRLWKNLLRWSEAFDNGVWSSGYSANMTRTACADADPAGTFTAETLTATANAARIVQQVSGAAASGTYTFSVWIKRRTGTGDIRIYTNYDNNISTVVSGVTSSWQRFSFTGVGSGQWPGIMLATSGDAIDVYGAQLEYGSAATAYEAKGADATITEVFRGNKRDFPRLAGIVAEAGNVTIYDLTEPGRPMWLRAVGGTYTAFPGGGVSSIAAMNGIVCVGGNNAASSFAFAGLRQVNFPLDTIRKHTSSNGHSGLFPAGIASRNMELFNPTGSEQLIANAVVNAVAMTVLPDAPVDPVTGLRMPTIAVATAGGTSVIKHNGTVVNSSLTFAHQSVDIKGTTLFVGDAARFPYFASNIGGLGPSFVLSSYGNYGQAGGWQITLAKLVAAARNQQYGYFGRAAYGGKTNEAASIRGLGFRIDSTFNTGWMTGDIRRCFLSDTGIGSLTAGVSLFSDLFTPDRVLTSGTSWRPIIATASVTGGVLEIRHDHVNSPTGRVVSAADLVEPGKTYRCRWTVESLVGNATGSVVGLGQDNSGNGGVSSGPLTGVGSFEAVIQVPLTATGRRITMFANGGTATGAVAGVRVSAFTVEEIVSDRSFRGAGALVAGTLTRAQLASGTSLVGYSGFSSANYLREPFSADLDFGTGEWTASAWVNVPASMPDGSFPVIAGDLVTNGQFGEAVTGWSVQNGAALSIVSGALRVTDDGVDGAVARATQVISTVAGMTYLLTGTVPAGSGGSGVIALSPNTSFNGQPNRTLTPGQTGSVVFVATSSTTTVILAVNGVGAGTTADFDNVSVREVGPAIIFDRAASTGPRLRLGVDAAGRLTAEAFDGTTTRTVTTSAAYNTAQWLKARVNYTTDGTLAILVNGREVAATRGAPLLTLNNSSAVLTIGNSFALDAPFPGSIALLKLGATVPTPEQATFMFEQEKQLFRAGALSVLPDSGAIVDMAYDDATDRWVAVSAANESYWTGLVRNSVQAVPAGSFSRVVAGSGLELAARTGTNPGVDVTIPAYGLREELVRRAEAAARLSRELVAFDFVGGFTANTTNGSAAITNVAGLTYPGTLIGARVSGAGIPANTRIVGVSGTTIYLSAVCTATATGVSISFLDFNLPVAFEARAVLSAGALRREGSTADYTRLYDGFLETIRFAVAPGATAWVQIQATRGTMQ